MINFYCRQYKLSNFHLFSIFIYFSYIYWGVLRFLNYRKISHTLLSVAEVLSWFSATIQWTDQEAQQKPQGLRIFWLWNRMWNIFFFFSKDEAADPGHMSILCQDFLFYTPCGYWLLNLPGVMGSVCYRN